MNKIEQMPLKDLKAWAEAQKNFDEAIAVLSADPRKGAQKLAQKLLRAQEMAAAEKALQLHMWKYEHLLHQEEFQNIAGTDEAGRGPLAGPVVAAAVVLAKDFYFSGIRDSKKMSPKKREAAAAYIKEHALAWRIEAISHQWIDEHNILKAAELAMARATAHLNLSVDYLLVDGNNQPPIDIPQKNIIKGDSLSISIACAGILAKVWRDDYMLQMDAKYPEYGFAIHKGYGTKEHMTAIAKYGPSPIHRRSFRLK